MRARLEAWMGRLGIAGVLGLGVLAACAAFWSSALQPVEDELAAQRLASERLRSRAPYQPVASGGRAEELRRFHALFPDSEQANDQLQRLHRMAHRTGLELAQGEYRLERRPAGLWAYRVTLPVAGSYAALRAFIAAVLKDMPIASIDALRFERKRAADTQLEAQVRLTLHVRATGDLP